MIIAEQKHFHYMFWAIAGLIVVIWYGCLDQAGQATMIFTVRQIVGL